LAQPSGTFDSVCGENALDTHATRCIGRRSLAAVFHRLLFILICVGLALQAPAARALQKSPCPMEATMQAMLAAGDLDPAGLPDCCNDLQTFAATGHLCKTGADCGASTTAAWIPAQPISALTVLTSAIPMARPAPPFAAPAAQPWRPPAAR
jgi:hypothetical protein